MGLFRKKPKEPAPMTASDADRMQAELDAIKQQLAAAEQAKVDLEARLRSARRVQHGVGCEDHDARRGERSPRRAARHDRPGSHHARGPTRHPDVLERTAQPTPTRRRRPRRSPPRALRATRHPDHDHPAATTTGRSASTAARVADAAAPAAPAREDGRLDDLSTRLEMLAAAVAAHTGQMTETQARLERDRRTRPTPRCRRRTHGVD